MNAELFPELVDGDVIEAVSTNLDLREPNKEALELIAYEVAHHYDIAGADDTFEGVVDSATGVGKTYILAAAIEYFAALGKRNFAVIAPGKTILAKTEANFTLGHPKSLLAGMEVEPVVITTDNFASPNTATAMEDDGKVKLFIFTVQSLIKPQTETGRKTHEFQEGLGKAFYEHLVSLDDLIVFADEHHCYYGKAFSDAIRSLRPYALVGLTATPHPRTPKEQIIFRYPLAAAIADRLVKTPIIVGRKDDRADVLTKLQDGIRLVEMKEEAVTAYCQQTGAEKVNPVMLVVAQTIDDAKEVENLLKQPGVAGGRYANNVLVVTSESPDKALEQLDKVEELTSPVRIIVSVGMLKEGWDVKNVYVICSLRASVSEILTEQTLGRGLRLPFGDYTDNELLDTLEVLAHERYDELLKKAGVINEAFIDLRTRAALHQEDGKTTVEIEVEQVENPVDIVDGDGTTTGGDKPGIGITSTDEREKEAKAGVDALKVELKRQDGAVISVPRLVMQTVKSPFSLNEITDLAPFKQLGEQLAANPDEELRRERLDAKVITGEDGLRHTELVPTAAENKVVSKATVIPLDEAKKQLFEALMNAEIVPTRQAEKNAAKNLVEAFVSGLGTHAQNVLSRFLGRAAARLIQLVVSEQRKVRAKPKFTRVVELVPLGGARQGRPTTSANHHGSFTKTTGYIGWSKRAMYEQAWFDSSTERAVASILDDADDVTLWVRLHRNDLPILWQDGSSYNPDFVAVEKDGTHWVIEAKMNKEMTSEEVKGKREAAQRWANYVSNDPKTGGVKWRYLLASEDDIEEAKGDWTALKSLATT